MHKGESRGSGSERVITQLQADSCCAASERKTSDQPNPTLTVVISSAVLGPGIILPTTVPALVLSDAWRTVAPTPTTPVPKHLLLSVFLV